MTTVSLRATRSFITNEVSLDGNTVVNQGTTTTYQITDFNSFSRYTVSSDVGTATISDDVITLTLPTTTATQVTITVNKDNSVSQFVVAIGATRIVTPVLTSPQNNSTNINLAPVLAAQPFATAPVGVDTQVSARWQVATDAAFTNIVYDSGSTTTGMTQQQVPAGILSLNTPYYARVQFTGATLGQSLWSSPNLFTTSNQYVAQPTLTESDNVLSTGETPTLTGSAFSVINGSDIHSASDWQIIRVSDGVVVWESLGNSANKVSIRVPAGVLETSKAYRARLRYAGATLGYGAWAELNFTTAAQFSYGQYMLFEGTALRNGQSLPAPAGVIMCGRKLNQFIELPSQPALAPFQTPNDGYYESGGGLTSKNQAFRPDGQYLVMTNSTRNATVYKRNQDSFDRLALPITPDANFVNCAKWINNEILLVGSGMNMNVYCQIGDQFVKLPNAPHTPTPSYQSRDNSWAQIMIHPSGQYLMGIVANAQQYKSSYFVIWKINGTGIQTTFTYITKVSMSGFMSFAMWTPDGTRIWAGGHTIQCIMYKWENEAVSSVWQPQFIQPLTCAFSPNGQYLAMQVSNNVQVYKKNAGQESYTFLKDLYSGGNGALSSQYRESVQFTADGTLLLGMGGEYENAGPNVQRLIIADATTDDFNIVPAVDFIVQNGGTRIQLYPAVPGSQ